MVTILGRELNLDVPDWEAMLRSEKMRNRALTLQAMANLEIKMVTNMARAPGQRDILREVQRLQKQRDWPVFSNNSKWQIQKNILTLIEEGHVISLDHEERQGKRGPHSPWRTVYIFPLLQNALIDELRKEEEDEDTNELIYA